MRPTKEEIKQAAHEEVVKLIKEYYHDLPGVDVVKVPEYDIFMHVFLCGCTFALTFGRP